MPHKNLEAWKQSMNLVVEIYNETKKFPKEEMFGLSQQMRRSAVSVPSNIAEGCSRNGKKETIQFLFIAKASLAELETQIIISNQVGYISDTLLKEIITKIDEIKRILVGLIKLYKSKNSNI